MSEVQTDEVRLTAQRIGLLVLMTALTAFLAVAALSFPPSAPRLADLALARAPESKMENAVTAVLINFRGYDTMLEVTVLLLSVVGIWSIARQPRIVRRQPDTPILSAMVRSVMPLMIFMAGYLFWIGAADPGGAFQGGAVLGGLGVLWVSASLGRPHPWTQGLVRPLLAAGSLTFILIAATLLFTEGRLLQYTPKYVKELILLIEAPAVFSIGLTLSLLFVGGKPEGEKD